MEKRGRGQRSEGGGGGGVVVDYLAQFFPRMRRRGRILGEVVDAPSYMEELSAVAPTPRPMAALAKLVSALAAP